MKQLGKFLFIGIAIFALVALVMPITAQDAPKPGEGGIIIEGNFGGDPATMNPLLASDTSSTRVAGFLFPALIGVDPKTATFVKNDPAALVTDWTISEDGLVYTFSIKDNWVWSDGTPITTADVMYSWNAIVAGGEGVVDTQLVYLLDIIDNVEAPDATTLVVTFKVADCTALGSSSLPVVPSHILPADLGELNNSDFNLAPAVTGGVFSFGEFRASEQVSLLANQAYSGAANGVIPTGWIYKVVPDQTVLVEQFLAGETNVIDGPPVNRRSDVLAAQDAGSVQAYQYPGNAWDYLALNYADPTNPQNGFDEAGNPIDQGHHPLFGDVRVRQAIAQAINVDEIIQGAVFGLGTRMASTMIPASWAYDQNLAPIAQNVEAAKALLAEAGFVDADNDPSTPLVAQGAMYAPDGTEFKFTLYSNEGNSRRGAIGTIVQDQLKQLGIVVDFQAIDFNTLLDIMDAQTFDAFILGWRNGYPDDPDQTQLFGSHGDMIGGGSNNVSYSNAELDALMEQARALPGCDPAARAEIYHQIQAITQQDLPYIPMFSVEGMYAASATVSGFSPYPSQLYWNIETWAAATP